MFHFLGTCVKYSFYGTVLTAGVGAAFLYKTKPSNESFHKFRSETEVTTGSEIVDSVVLNTCFNVNFQDYVVFKTASYSLKFSQGNIKRIYIGAANNWALVSENKN